MIAVIVKEELLGSVKKAVEQYSGNSFDDTCTYKKTTELGSQLLQNSFQELQRINIEMLIIDIDSGEQQIVPLLRSYRIARPETRIIIIAPDKQPGDATLSAIVAKGIYDIITPEGETDFTDSLFQVLNKPMTYTEAARWDVIGEAFNTAKKQANKILKTTEIKGASGEQQFIIKERIVGRVVIAVASMSNGLGCTHTALSISKFLSDRQLDTALVELNDKPCLHILENTFDKVSKGKTEDSFNVCGFDIYPRGEGDFNKFLNKNYTCIVLDLGVLKRVDNVTNSHIYSNFYQEMIRSDYPILVASTAPWRLKDFSPYAYDQDIKEYQIMLPMGDEKICNDLSNYTNKLPVIFPYQEDPFKLKDVHNDVLEKLFKKILPAEATTTKKGLFSVFKSIN